MLSTLSTLSIAIGLSIVFILSIPRIVHSFSAVRVHLYRHIPYTAYNFRSCTPCWSLYIDRRIKHMIFAFCSATYNHRQPLSAFVDDTLSKAFFMRSITSFSISSRPRPPILVAVPVKYFSTTLLSYPQRLKYLRSLI